MWVKEKIGIEREKGKSQHSTKEVKYNKVVNHHVAAVEESHIEDTLRTHDRDTEEESNTQHSHKQTQISVADIEQLPTN
eukprot:14709771-Heterocapsa_arctica.AAC.1